MRNDDLQRTDALEPNISKTVGDRGSVPTDQQQEMASPVQETGIVSCLFSHQIFKNTWFIETYFNHLDSPITRDVSDTSSM